MWYQSVGFDSVFWTRLGAQVGLFVVAAIGALVDRAAATCGWPAARPTRGTATGRRPFRDLVRAAQRCGGPSGGPAARGPAAPDGAARPSPSTRRHPGPHARRRAGPRRRWRPRRADDRRVRRGSVGDGPALGQPRAVLAGPSGARGRPVFGRDIGFFLFELPFLRLVQSLFNGLVIAAPARRRRRYLVGGVARRARLHDPGPGPPRRARRAVPPLGRLRLPARQVRARRTARGASPPASATPTRTPSSSPTTS